MRKAMIIARVSTEEQKDKNNSLPAQLRRMEEYCSRNNFEVTDKVSFDETAYKQTRDKFDKTVDKILSSKDYLAVCFDKVDRLSRDVFDQRISNLYEKAVSGEIEIHFVSDSQILDRNVNAADKFMFSIKLGLAKYYSDAISDNVKRVMEHKVRNGLITSKAPYGYNNIRDEQDNATVEIDPIKGEIVKKVFDMYTSGNESYRGIAKKINKQFPTLKLSKRKVETILTNRFYYGEREYKGEIYGHVYPTLISHEIFELAEDKRLGRTRRKERRKLSDTKSTYGGLITCAECGCAFSPSINRHKRLNRNTNSDYYYYCTNSKQTHKQKPEGTNDADLDERFGEIFKTIQIPKERLEWIVIALKESTQDKQQFAGTQRDHFQGEINKLQKRIETAYMDRLDGRITPELFDEKNKEWTRKIKQLEGRIGNLTESDEKYYATASALLELASRSYELFMGSGMDEKRQLIKLSLQNLEMKDGKLLYDWVKPFDSIFVAASSHDWGGRSDAHRTNEEHA